MTYYFKIWDPELEAIAQRWAEQCPSGPSAHDTNQKKLDGTLVGQNIAWFYTRWFCFRCRGMVQRG